MIYEKNTPIWIVVVAATEFEMERFDDCRIDAQWFGEAELQLMSATIEAGPFSDRDLAVETETQIFKEILRGHEI
jgi:hypothetical protein